MFAQTAPDATAGVPDVPITTSEYKLPAGFDDIVLADAPANRRLQTELWADRVLNLRRGRLVLRHLEQLQKWNSGAQTPPAAIADLVGKIDFGHAGLMGHSRGGEGVRAAYNFYNDPSQPAGFPPNWQTRIPGLNIQGIFE